MSDVFRPGFVAAVNTENGKPQVVPAHFIGHPTLGKHLKLADQPSDPESEAVELQSTTPVESWGRDRIDAHAAALRPSLDTTSLKTKADALAAIADHVPA